MYYVKLKEGPDKARVEQLFNGYADGHVTLRKAWAELCAIYLRRKNRFPIQEIAGHCYLTGSWQKPHVHADFDDALDCYVGNWGLDGATHLVVFHFPHYALVAFSGSQKDCIKKCDVLNRNKNGEIYEVRYEY